VRHGESTWNEERRIQGQLDPPLSERGRDQAQLIATRLAGHEVAAFYTSDLRRTRETAAPIERILDLPAVALPELREIALGEWEGKTRDELMEGYPELWAEWTRDPDWDLVPGGEGAATFDRRVQEAIERLLNRHHGSEVVCVTHGGVIQTALAGVVGRKPRGIFPFVIHNASLTVLQRWNGRTVVTAVNDTCHLK
jgi:probable phosphoglycerate mutase